MTLSIYGVDGRRLAQRVDREVTAGQCTMTWDGRDGAGSLLPAGIYYAALECGGEMTLLRRDARFSPMDGQWRTKP